MTGAPLQMLWAAAAAFLPRPSGASAGAPVCQESRQLCVASPFLFPLSSRHPVRNKKSYDFIKGGALASSSAAPTLLTAFSLYEGQRAEDSLQDLVLLPSLGSGHQTQPVRLGSTSALWAFHQPPESLAER